MPIEEPKHHLQSRRSFLDLVMGAGIAVWAGAMIAPTLAYLWPARKGGAKSLQADVGAVEDFAVGTGRMIASEGKPILVIRVTQERFRAFSAICTHLGCVVKWEPSSRDIRCPCHAAVFSAEGKVVAGPPPKPLYEYDVLVANGKVVVKL